MIALFAALAILGFALWGLRLLRDTPPEVLARWSRSAWPLALIAVGGILTLLGRGIIGLPILGIGMAGWRRAKKSPSARRGGRGARASTVTSAYFKMTLDHASGRLDGDIIAGSRRGSRLASLNRAELLRLFGEVRDDHDSVRLLEAYLDRRSPGWRDDANRGSRDGLGAAPSTGSMTEEQAYEILGLQSGATVAEVRDAHRRLMKRVHPDHGGTDFLAARVNEAKALLIGRHR
ncbi:DnaJ domain-containing protein [Consotaella salsifontis]|uniref:DnaJ domain-containing protein n=1 Tax=Consotaella salsifontis TaxID=1365950 RepID=UPI0013F6064D|nr:DnaJ domain-containing protein [Consotaella salsifontis]